MEGEHEWTQLLNLKGWLFDLQISPDGRWLAYSSWESGGANVNVHPFPDVDDGRWQGPSGGGIVFLLWSPNGHKLFYTVGTSLMSVEVGTEPTFKFGKSEVLFNATDKGLLRRAILPGGFDISHDGKRFLMFKEAATTDNESQAKEAPAEEPRKINIVLNWFEELKEQVPMP